MRKSPTAKNLIAGCAFNYTTRDILPFLKSLQACGYSDDLILLTNDQSNISLEGYTYKGIIINVDRDFSYAGRKKRVRNRTAKPGVFRKTDPYLISRTLSHLEKGKRLSKSMVAFFYNSYFLMTSRYFLYYYYLVDLGYPNVFLTDVNDVFFQGNPFEQKYENGVTAFAEQDGISIAEEVTNRFWILATFGETVLQSMADKVVYCAGTILLKNSTKQFLKDFLRIVIRNKISRTIQGVDQGVYNYMLHFLKLKYFNTKRNGDTVLTVANVPEQFISLSEQGIALAGSNDLPDVVHQYIRFEQQKEFVTKRVQQL